MMDSAKLGIVSDGFETGVMLDGTVFLCGVEKMFFGTDSGGPAILNLTLDVESVRISTDTEKFSKFVERISQKNVDAPVSGECVQSENVTQEEL